MRRGMPVAVFDAEKLVSLQTASTSKGNQAKWYDPGKNRYVKAQFYYQGKYWRDDLVELIATRIGENLKLTDTDVRIVHQELCDIRYAGRTLHGVCSENFCRPGERFLPLYRILQLQELEFPYGGTIQDKWDLVIAAVKECADLDLTDYLLVMTVIDFLTGNEDRHLSNIGILTDDKVFRMSPLFDFGLGLFEHDRVYEGVPLRDCIRMMDFKPFDRDGERVIEFCRQNYDISRLIPPVMDLSDLELPSAKAGSYLINRGRYLEIRMEGIE